MTNAHAEPRSNSLFVQGVAQYTAVGSGFFIVRDLNVASRAATAVDFVRYHMRRRVVEAQLTSLSDRMLTDIGIVRGDIPALAWKWAKSGSPFGAVEKAPSVIASLMSKTGRSVKQWVHRQLLEAELHGMNDRMLDDIGVERADIPTIARQRAEPEAARVKVRVVEPGTEIGAIVSSGDVTMTTVANDTDEVRVAS